MSDYLLLVLAWAGFFAFHSLGASLTMKRWVAARRPAVMPAYRLIFNFLALLLLLPVLALMHRLDGAWLWRWEGVAFLFANGLAILAAAGFLWSLRWYDGQEFMGLRQIRGGVKSVEDQEQFHLSPLHRHVRHPWYSFGLVILWTRDMNPALLISALLITLYLVIGYRLEERKLIAYHGERYRRYRERVPALVPLPWKRLDAKEAHRISTKENPPPDKNKVGSGG